MLKLKGYIPLLALLFALTLLPSCLFRSKIPVAVMTKLEAGSIVGTSEINAAKLFLDDNNIKSIEIVPLDDGWDPQKAKSAFKELKKRGIRILITSHVSTCALAIENDINREKVLTIITGATTDALSNKNDYIIRVIQDVAHEQRSIAEYVNAQPESGVIIIRDTDNYAYTLPALKHFTENLKKPVVRIIETSISNPDMDAIRKSIPQGGNNIVYLLIGGYQIAAGSIAQVVNGVLPAARILFTPWMKTPTLLETLGKSEERSIMPSHNPPRDTNRAIKTYVNRFKKRFGYPPTFISLNVYAALEILNEAIDAGNTDPEDIKNYILKKKTFRTTFGPVTFDANGDIRGRMYFITDLSKEF